MHDKHPTQAIISSFESSNKGAFTREILDTIAKTHTLGHPLLFVTLSVAT